MSSFGEIEGVLTAELHLNHYTGHGTNYGVIILKSTTQKVHDVDMVAVVDLSASMVGTKMDIVQSTLESICKLSTAASTLSIVGFSNTSKVYTDRLPVGNCSDTIRNLSAFGATNFSAGIDSGLEQLSKIAPDRRKAFFAFTDGQINRGIIDRDQLYNHFENLWKKYNNDSYLWLASIGSFSDYELIRKLSKISETSTFNHIQDVDYGEFADQIGNLIAICQSTYSGEINICGQKIPFCLPREGVNSYLFSIDEPGDVIAQFTGHHSLQLQTTFEMDKQDTVSLMKPLIDILILKKKCLETLLDLSSATNSVKLDVFNNTLLDISEQFGNVTDMDHDVYCKEKLVLKTLIEKLTIALKTTLTAEERCVLSSKTLQLKRQSSSGYTSQIGKLFRSRSCQPDIELSSTSSISNLEFDPTIDILPGFIPLYGMHDQKDDLCQTSNQIEQTLPRNSIWPEPTAWDYAIIPGLSHTSDPQIESESAENVNQLLKHFHSSF
jgi:uncharacterized protein YegL